MRTDHKDRHDIKCRNSLKFLWAVKMYQRNNPRVNYTEKLQMKEILPGHKRYHGTRICQKRLKLCYVECTTCLFWHMEQKQ